MKFRFGQQTMPWRHHRVGGACTLAVVICLSLSAGHLSPAPARRTVMLAPFSPLAVTGPANAELQRAVLSSLKLRLEREGFRVLRAPVPIRTGLKAGLVAARAAGARVLIGGFYHRRKPRPGQRARRGVDLYAQVIHADTGLVIDAASITEIVLESEGIRLPPEERSTPAQVMRRLGDKLATALRANPNRRVRRENIQEHISARPVARAMRFPIQTVTVQRRADEVFRLFGEVKVVTASRRGQRISEAPSNIVALTREMIHRRGYLTLTEALQDVPYFDFTTFHDGGEYPTHFLLRGLTDVGQTKVLMMEDGIVQNDISFGWSRNLNYNTTFSDVERVEIILGPGSALYGANAYAGLINVITRSADQLYSGSRRSGLLFDGGVLYGPDGTRKEQGLLADTNLGGLGREDRARHAYAYDGLAAYRLDSGLTFQLAARFFHADGDGGDRRPDPGNYFHNNLEPGTVFTTEYGTVSNDSSLTGNKRLRDGFNTEKNSIFLRGKVSYRKFTLAFNYWDRHDGLASYVPGYEYFTNTDGKPYEVHHRGYTLSMTYDTPFSRKVNLRSRAYYRATLVLPETGFVYTYRFQDVDRPVLNGTALPPVSDLCKCYHAQGQVFGLEEQLNMKLNRNNELVVGMQLERLTRQFLGISLGPQQAGDSNVVPFSFSDEGPFHQTTKTEVFYTTNAAFFVQDEQKFLRHYALTGGLRYDVLSDVDGADRLAAGSRTVAAGILNVRAGLVGLPQIALLRGLNFKLLYGEAFKSPTLFELFDEFRGNPNLKPQRIKTYEAMLGYAPVKQVRLEASYFISFLQDVIEIRPNDGTIPIGNASQKETFSQNVEATHMYGATVGVRYQLGRRLFVYGNYSTTGDRDSKTPLNVQTDLRGRITSISLREDGREIDNIAMRKGNLGVNYLLQKRFNFNLRANRVGRRKAPTTNKYFQPYDYTFARDNFDYETEGSPDGYMSGYTIWHFTFTWQDAFGYLGLEPQLIVRNLLNTAYAGIGRQAGSGVRPISASQAANANPPGFIPAYHPQPGRQVMFRVNYRY